MNVYKHKEIEFCPQCVEAGTDLSCDHERDWTGWVEWAE